MPPKFAANISLLWPELPYLDRFEAAAEAGFQAVEILFPYDIAAKETKRALIANGLELVLMNAPPPITRVARVALPQSPSRWSGFARTSSAPTDLPKALAQAVCM